MTHLSLFSGIGWLDLAAEWAGFLTVGQCEFADYPTKVLEKHWPDVPRWRDIHTLTGESFYARTGLRTVDVISGGFPCQPFSVAGKQKGKGDDRYLWPEMCRVIGELKPRWVVGENVPGILRIAAKDVIKDLEGLGYHVMLLDFEAAAVGALHRRERIAFVANRDGVREQPAPGLRPEGGDGAGDGGKALADAKRRAMRNDGDHDGPPDREEHALANAGDACTKDVSYAKSERRGAWRAEPEGQPRESFIGYGGETVCNAECGGLSRNNGRKSMPESAGRCKDATNAYSDRLEEPGLQGLSQEPTVPVANNGWWAAEPDVGRVAYGVPHRVDRLKCLGNAVVPQQFYPIYKAIAEVTRSNAV